MSQTLRLGDARVFLQPLGISPANPYRYMGRMSLDGPEQGQGEPTPIYEPSSTQRNAWVIVDEAPTVPDLGSTDFTQQMDLSLSDVWWDIRRRNCVFNLQITLGRCNRPDDFNDWQAKILLDRARLTNFTLPTLNPLSGEDNAGGEMTGSLSFRDIVRIVPIRFSQKDSESITTELLDVLFYGDIQCGDCGPASDGCDRAYILSLAPSGGKSSILYTLNGFGSLASLTISTLGADESGSAMAVVGDSLVVVSEDSNSHHVISLSDLNAGIDGWAEVATGYVPDGEPRAIYSRSAAETFIAGAGGYIYLLENPTGGVSPVTDGSLTAQDLNAIHGNGRTIVAVGDANAVLMSSNDGKSFSAVTGPAVGVALNTVWVMTDYIWFIGAADGSLYYTLDAGRTWTEIALPSGTTSVNHIVFEEDEGGQTVGYLATSHGSGARVYRTTDGGHSWHYTGSPISGLPSSAQRINRLAVCGANMVAAVGLGADTDGIAAVAS